MLLMCRLEQIGHLVHKNVRPVYGMQKTVEEQTMRPFSATFNP